MTAPDSVLLIKANSSISNPTAARLGATCRERVTFFDSSLSFVFFLCVSLSYPKATRRQVLALLQRSSVYVFLILALHGTVVFSAAPAGGVRGVGMGSGSCGPLRVPLCLINSFIFNPKSEIIGTYLLQQALDVIDASTAVRLQNKSKSQAGGWHVHFRPSKHEKA